MNAFGAGKYSFIDKYLVKCDFGGREHLLKFNGNYSRFISVRKDDFEVVAGNQIVSSTISNVMVTGGSKQNSFLKKYLKYKVKYNKLKKTNIS